MTIDEAASSDTLFFWDKLEVGVNIEADLLSLLVQPRGRLFYNRGYGCGIESYENMPNTLLQAIMLRYTVVNAFAERNARVTDGSGGYPDRRALTSQTAVDVEQVGEELNLVVGYIEYADAETPQKLTVPWRG